MAVTNGGMTLYENNNAQASWLGSDDYDAEVSKDGGGSEAWLVGKNANETTTLTKGGITGTPKYFTCWMKSDWGAFYSTIFMRLLDGTNTNSFTVATGGKNATPNLTPEISGDFKPSVLQINQGSVPAYVASNTTQFQVNVDASSSGNIRAIVNHWIDGMWYGNGRDIGGTTASDKLFKESDDLDISSSNYDGCSVVFDSGLAYYTDVIISTTTGNSFGEVITWYGKLTTDGAFTLSITGTADFQNTSLLGNAATIGLNSSTATSFAMSGGGITNGGSIVFGSGQSINGVVFSNCTSFTIPNTLSSCTINGSGLVTLTGALTNCTIQNSTSTVSVSASTLNNITGCNFVSDGSNHAIDLGTIASNITMDWDNAFSGYATTDGATGNEVILVNVNNGVTLTINSASGTPSVYNTGTGTVNVVSGQVTFTLTVKDTAGAVIQGAMVYVLADAGGSLAQGTPIIDKVTTDALGQVSDTRSLGSNQPIIGKVRKSTSTPFYKTAGVVGTISSTGGLDLTVQMISDE